MAASRIKQLKVGRLAQVSEQTFRTLYLWLDNAWFAYLGIASSQKETKRSNPDASRQVTASSSPNGRQLASTMVVRSSVSSSFASLPAPSSASPGFGAGDSYDRAEPVGWARADEPVGWADEPVGWADEPVGCTYQLIPVSSPISKSDMLVRNAMCSQVTGL